MSDQSERLHLEGLDEATERERWEEHHAPVEAAALTEQIAELLVEHQRIPMFDGTDGQRCSGGCDELRGEPDGPNSPRHAAHVASILAARLADSRPAVTEAAVEAAAEALWADFVKGEGDYPAFDQYPKKQQDYWRHDARVALSAALPHMGDGKAQAWDKAMETAGDCGCPHDTACSFQTAKNPYRDSHE